MPLHSCRSKKATSGTGLYHPPYFDAESLLLFIAALHVLGYLVYQLPVDSPVFAFHLTTGVLALQMYATPWSETHIIMLRQHTLLSTEPYLILGSRSSFFSLWYSQVTKFCKFYLLHLWLYKVTVCVLPISTQTQSCHLLSLQVPTR